MLHLSDIPKYSLAAVRRFKNRSSSNFKLAFMFLKPEQRTGLEHVYSFCRIVDDIVDERPPGQAGIDTARSELELWTKDVAAIYSGGEAEPSQDLAKKLIEVVEHFDLPREGFDEIIKGCATDLEKSAYATLDELSTYCYQVASCVGLLCIGIFGNQSEPAKKYAYHLGLALQYTNILRDVGEDAMIGRVYLPEDLLHEHGLSRDDVLQQNYDPRFSKAAAAFADIAEAEYQTAWKILDTIEDQRPLLPAEIMGRTYYEILAKIRQRRFSVFCRRTSLRRRDKLKVAALTIARTGLLPGLSNYSANR